MTDDLLTLIQGMYHSNEIYDFISARLPDDKLSTGWVEQGLVYKGFTGKMHDKRIQEQLVIPTDRFARLIQDRAVDSSSLIGLLLFGEHGIREPKFVTLIFNESPDSRSTLMALTFRSKEMSQSEIIRIISKHVLGNDKAPSNIESKLDYVEQLNTDAVHGNIEAFLSLRLPSPKKSVNEWIRSSVNGINDPSEVIAYHGDLDELSSIALLFSRWLTSLDAFKKIRKGIAAIFLKYGNKIESCFWDIPQNLATFVISNEMNLERYVNEYALALWSKSSDIVDIKSMKPEVVVEERKSLDGRLHTIIDELNRRLTTFSPTELRNRIETLESRLDLLEQDIKSKDSPEIRSISVVKTRLEMTTDRLEQLLSRLSALEERIKKVSKE
ncbi:MAG: hypothetical protein JW779_04510 [Candidatus Thorarchaeota archaeon]|nr:hypothetical protein [Candidatus Thorarchaeota archaeon]